MAEPTDAPSYLVLADQVFGDLDDPMELLEMRAETLLGDLRAVVWEGDATTFQFLYVSRSAEEVFGYPRDRWTTEPTFWADTVVVPDERDYAVSYCALCTGKGQDHDFHYHARRADGRVIRIHDLVRVVMGRRRVATRLRGIMIEVPDA